MMVARITRFDTAMPQEHDDRKKIQDLTAGVLESQNWRDTPAEKLDLFLSHLSDNWTQDLVDARKKLNEHQIGVDVFGQSKDWDSHDNGIVRVYKHRLRARLRGFFLYSEEGRRHVHRLEVPKRGPYVLQLVKNELNLEPEEKFWDTHAINNAPNVIISTDPLW